MRRPHGAMMRPMARKSAQLLAVLPRPVSVKAVWVRGAFGSIHGTLQAAGFFPWLNDGVAEFYQRSGIVTDHGNGARADVQADNRAAGLLVLYRGKTFLHELHKPAARTIHVAPQHAAILRPAGQCLVQIGVLLLGG